MFILHECKTSHYFFLGEYIDRILRRAYRVPLVNLEDVFFTQVVARDSVGLTLTHDRRLSPYKPWISCSCSWWGLALAHSLEPGEILAAWPKLLEVARELEKDWDVCGLFSFLSSDMFLY